MTPIMGQVLDISAECLVDSQSCMGEQRQQSKAALAPMSPAAASRRRSSSRGSPGRLARSLILGRRACSTGESDRTPRPRGSEPARHRRQTMGHGAPSGRRASVYSAPPRTECGVLPVSVYDLSAAHRLAPIMAMSNWTIVRDHPDHGAFYTPLPINRVEVAVVQFRGAWRFRSQLRSLGALRDR
jgi:hypothetical protein